MGKKKKDKVFYKERKKIEEERKDRKGKEKEEQKKKGEEKKGKEKKGKEEAAGQIDRSKNMWIMCVCRSSWIRPDHPKVTLIFSWIGTTEIPFLNKPHGLRMFPNSLENCEMMK